VWLPHDLRRSFLIVEDVVLIKTQEERKHGGVAGTVAEIR
jgi:hypothetical protein